MRCIYLTTDLLFSSRVASLARERGFVLDIVSNLAAAQELATLPDVRLVIVDLVLPHLDIAAATRELRATIPAVALLAYGPHVDEARLNAAREAGCQHVVPRSAFQGRLVQLLDDLARSESSPS